LIFFIERIELVGIYVENREQITPWPKNRHHDFGARACITSYVTGIFVDVGNNNGPHFCRGGSADSTAENDIETAQRALVWSDAQQRPRLDDPIKASPEMSERVMHERGDRCHRSNWV
jgi:hypothetical protein